MAEEDEAIDADVDVGDTLKTLLEATRSQATVNTGASSTSTTYRGA